MNTNLETRTAFGIFLCNYAYFLDVRNRSVEGVPLLEEARRLIQDEKEQAALMRAVSEYSYQFAVVGKRFAAARTHLQTMLKAFGTHEKIDLRWAAYASAIEYSILKRNAERLESLLEHSYGFIFATDNLKFQSEWSSYRAHLAVFRGDTAAADVFAKFCLQNHPQAASSLYCQVAHASTASARGKSELAARLLSEAQKVADTNYRKLYVEVAGKNQKF